MRGTTATLLLAILIITAANAVGEPSLKKVSFIPQWIPQAQFAGYMVALEKGLYRQAGLDVTLLEGGPGKSPCDYLRMGKATFGTSWLATGLEERASGMPIVNIGQIIQRSALMLIADKGKGIEGLADLDGKKVALWEGHFRLQPTLFFRRRGVKVEIVSNYSTVNLFLKHGVSATWAMWYNEYHLILNSGYNPDELTVFYLKDSELNFPEDGLYCMEHTYRNDPEMCSAFVDASIKGWLYAFKHKEEALDIVMKHTEAAHTGTNRAHQRWMLARMEDVIAPKGRIQNVGKLDPQDYALVGEVLQDNSTIEHVPPLAEFYKGPQ